MLELLQNLTSIGWWFSTVVVALVINILSAYAKPWIDSKLERFSKSRLAKNEAVRLRHETELNRAVTNNDSMLYIVEEENRTRLRSLYALVFALVMLATNLLMHNLNVTGIQQVIVVSIQVILQIGSLVFVGFASNGWSETSRLTMIARQAREIRAVRNCTP